MYILKKWFLWASFIAALHASSDIPLYTVDSFDPFSSSISAVFLSEHGRSLRQRRELPTSPSFLSGGSAAQTSASVSSSSSPSKPTQSSPTPISRLWITGSTTTSDAPKPSPLVTSQPSTEPRKPATQSMSTPKMVKMPKDYHEYYTSQALDEIEFNSYFKNLSELTKPDKSLSDKHRVAAPESLGFDFPFYGHRLDKVTIATGGFLYMSDFLHQFLTYGQYVAPLMANFDSQLGNDSHVFHLREPHRFTVQWQNLHLQDQQDAGSFDFQVILEESGQIYFLYKRLSLPIQNISTLEHPVKVGVSDAYYVDKKSQHNTMVRTIFRYHTVDLVKDMRIQSGRGILLTPVPNCVAQQSCGQCLDPERALRNFNCSWCPTLLRCSDGLDRGRQEWVNNCRHELTSMRPGDNCSETHKYLPHKPIEPAASTGDDVQSLRVVGIVFLVALICLIISGVVAFFLYAYRNPNSDAGQWLIQNRPSVLMGKVRFWKSGVDPDAAGGSSADKYGVSVERLPHSGENVA